MRYAITGSTGFVGGALARRLVHDGNDVVALVRGRGVADSVHPAIQAVRGDVFDDAALDRLCAGIDGLFHVAGWYKLGVRDPTEGVRVNVEGTRNVLAAAMRCDVPRTVYTSTLAVNSDTHGLVADESYHFSG